MSGNLAAELGCSEGVALKAIGGGSGVGAGVVHGRPSGGSSSSMSLLTGAILEEGVQSREQTPPGCMRCRVRGEGLLEMGEEVISAKQPHCLQGPPGGGAISTCEAVHGEKRPG